MICIIYYAKKKTLVRKHSSVGGQFLTISTPLNLYSSMNTNNGIVITHYRIILIHHNTGYNYANKINYYYYYNYNYINNNNNYNYNNNISNNNEKSHKYMRRPLQRLRTKNF